MPRCITTSLAGRRPGISTAAPAFSASSAWAPNCMTIAQLAGGAFLHLTRRQRSKLHSERPRRPRKGLILASWRSLDAPRSERSSRETLRSTIGIAWGAGPEGRGSAAAGGSIPPAPVWTDTHGRVTESMHGDGRCTSCTRRARSGHLRHPSPSCGQPGKTSVHTRRAHCRVRAAARGTGTRVEVGSEATERLRPRLQAQRASRRRRERPRSGASAVAS
jgi:hypothetical protein